MENSTQHWQEKLDLLRYEREQRSEVTRTQIERLDKDIAFVEQKIKELEEWKTLPLSKITVILSGPDKSGQLMHVHLIGFLYGIRIHAVYDAPNAHLLIGTNIPVPFREFIRFCDKTLAGILAPKTFPKLGAKYYAVNWDGSITGELEFNSASTFCVCAFESGNFYSTSEEANAASAAGKHQPPKQK